MARLLIVDRDGSLGTLLWDLVQAGYTAIIAHNDYEGATDGLQGSPLTPARTYWRISWSSDRRCICPRHPRDHHRP